MHELDDETVQKQVIDSIVSQLHVSDIQRVGEGNEFTIFKTELSADQPAAIKVPRDRIFSNANDPYIDSRVLVDQECNLIEYVRKQGVLEVPEPIQRFEAAGFEVMVMSYVASDDSKAYEFQLGALLARINTLPPPALQLSAQGTMEIPELLASRLHQRWQQLQKFVPELPDLPVASIIIQALEPIRQDKRLLHMDFRQANLRTKQGIVLAVLDWSNALIGHQALELARVAEFGEIGIAGRLSEAFLEGYATIAMLPVVSPLIETLFRLDTAVMLALVFLSEEPDPEQGSLMIERVRSLHSRLIGEINGPQAR